MSRIEAKILVRCLQIVLIVVAAAAAIFVTQHWASAQPSPDSHDAQIYLPLVSGGEQAADALQAAPAAAPVSAPVDTPESTPAPPPVAEPITEPVTAPDAWQAIAAADDIDNEPDNEPDTDSGADPGATPVPDNLDSFLFLPMVQTDRQGSPDVMAAAADTIFADGFESGSLSAWSARANSANMSVSAAAALVGSRGLQVLTNSSTGTFLTSEAPNGESRYRARFYFDPNSITMASGNSHYIFTGYTGSSTAVLRGQLQFSGGSYQFRTLFVDNGDIWTASPWFTIADAPHYIELDWLAATAPGAKNGGLTLWIDGVQKASYTGGDNNTRRIDRERIGAISGIDSGTRGTYFFDAFESRRQTYIGPDGGGPTPTPTSTPTSTPTGTPTSTPTSTPTNTPNPGPAPVIMAAGDIICSSMGSPTSSACAHMAVSQIVVNQPPAAVLTLGDNCHEPTAACYANYYGSSWGRFKAITHPMSGNHDYLTSGATPYYDYFNGAGSYSGPAGDRDKGYYSFDIGDWHIIGLNTQCSQVGGCSSGSPQYTWLENDLKTHPSRCTLAFYHIPLFSSGGRASANARGLFTLLYNYNAEIVLNGHDHIYERFAPQRYDGVLDNTRGIRQFIVGTGGANHTSIASVKPNSEVRNVDTFGVIKLTLYTDRYDWQFVPVAGKTFTDSGTTYCH